MASLDFPSNPTNNQTYALNGVTYYYNSAIGAWLTQLSTMNLSTSSNTQVLFNDAGLANGSTGLSYNKFANTLSANTINVNNFTAAVLAANTVFVDNIIEFTQTISQDYTITSGRNALSAGPVAIANANVVTIPSGSVWTVT